MPHSEPGTIAAPSARDVEERRQHPRRHIPGIFGTRRSPGDLTVLDVSLGGISAEVLGEMDPGQHCFLELVHEHHRVNVEAEVRWASVTRVEKSSDRFVPLFRAGLSFVEIDRGDGGGIWDWILPAAESRP